MDHVSRSWTETWAPKVLKQAKLEALTRSALGRAIDDIASLGKIFLRAVLVSHKFTSYYEGNLLLHRGE